MLIRGRRVSVVGKNFKIKKVFFFKGFSKSIKCLTISFRKLKKNFFNNS